MLPDEQPETEDLWNSGRLDKPKIDPAAETEEWLGEASAEDVDRLQNKPEDVYDQKPPIERPVTRITHIQVHRGDSFTYRILAIGFALLFCSTFVQVLRAESLEYPKVVVQPSPTPGQTGQPGELASEPDASGQNQAPEWNIPKENLGPPQVPTLSGLTAECQPGETVKLKVELTNRGSVASKPSMLLIELTPRGSKAVKISGPLPPMGPGQQAAFDIETPYEMNIPLSTDVGHFRTKEGLHVSYKAEVEEKK